jgi:hypothetical protein
MPKVGAFSQPFTYWVGMDTDPRTTPEALAEFNRFYSATHVHEVIGAHPGFVSVSRYELLEQDPRGNGHAGPRWLAVYAMADEAAAEQYVKDNARPWLHRRKYSPWPPARRRAKTIWRLIWRTISPPQPSEEVTLVGTNAHTDACFELYREFAHPPPGCPRFCLAFPGDPQETVWRLVYRQIA